MNDLTDAEKEFLALAIQGLCMRSGPTFFPMGITIAEKLGIKKQLRAMLLSWTAYGQTHTPDEEKTS